MAAKTTAGSVLGKIQNRINQAHEKHKDDDTDFGNGELPPGIENGIAQLVECKFDVYKTGNMQGQPFFYAAGVVKAPAEVGGVPVQGLRTQIMEPVCDTPTRTRSTVEDHVGWVYNELRKLGINTREIGPGDLEAVAQALKEIKPHFRFRTWRGTKKKPGTPGYNPQYDGPDAPLPKVQHEWLGRVEFHGEEDAGGATEDASPPAAVKPTNGKPVTTATRTPDHSPAEIRPEDLDGSDLDSLLARCLADDAHAQNHIKALALANGVTESEFDATTSWEEAVELVRASGTSSDPAGDEAGEEGIEAGDRFMFAAVNPRTKKKGPAVEVEVSAVDDEGGTADVFVVSSPKTKFKSVPWDDLEEIPE